MSTTEEQVDTRTQLRTMEPAAFIKAHTVAMLIAIATNLGIEEPKGSKQELYDAIVGASNLPNPALRGASSVEQPVAFVWELADKMFADAPEGETPRRKDVVAAAQEAGVAYYTARTQYQAWFSATGKGATRLADLAQDELPKSMQTSEEAADDA